MDGSAGSYWQLHFDENGQQAPGSSDPADVIEQVAGSGAQDLFVMSHGWGSSEGDADDLYRAMFPLVDAASEALGSARYLGVYWPSLWFPDPPAATLRGLSTQREAPPEPGQVDAALTGKAIADALAAGLPEVDQARVKRMGRLIDQGLKGSARGESHSVQQRRLEQFHALLTTVFATSATAAEDAGESALLSASDPQPAYRALARTMGSVAEVEDTRGLGDVFGDVWNGAKDALRVASYFQMKDRAGTVGRGGLGPFLTSLKAQVPDVRVHLVGHSFGARLVAFGLAGIPNASDSPVASLTLLQGAFSHWSFSDGSSQPGIRGALVGMQDRVHGPLCATFSDADWAVARWYPRASFLARQDDRDLQPPSRWGGMGADGYQGVIAHEIALPLTGAETFAPSAFHRVDANPVINDTSASAFAGAHSDIRKPAVAALIAAAAGSVPQA